MSKKCVNCREYKNCRDSSISLIFFIVGMIATIALRIVTVLMNIKPIYGKISWYIGVTGFLLYFLYKFKVERVRYKLILKNNLMDKIFSGKDITEKDRKIIGNILCALSSNKDRINYFLIFFSSTVALIVAFYLDFIK
ncbi:MAG: hypothetical protein NC918_03210 [Candidatus Omnitrophica bacterium]|nr:hypothetical protein [Candidatus Omnitrophota bacterium]